MDIFGRFNLTLHLTIDYLQAEYILNMGLGGGMVWSIDTDDYLGECHGEEFPLIKAIHRTLNGDIIIVTPPTTTEDPSKPVSFNKGFLQ